MSLKITKHCDERFSQRVAKTKRMQKFITDALYLGMGTNEIKHSGLRKELEKREKEYNAIAKIYRNSVYWFDGETAITVYPLAQKFHGRI